MKEYVHLKDGIVFAHHKTEGDVDDSSDTVIEVTGDLDSYLNKKYENGSFIEAPEIKWAVLDEDNNNTVIAIKSTIFSSEVKGPVINDNNVKILWRWDGNNFIAPQDNSHPIVYVDSVPVTTSNSMPAVSETSLKQLEEDKVNIDEIIAKQKEADAEAEKQAQQSQIISAPPPID